MTVQEAANYARSGRALVYRALHTGELRGMQNTRPKGTWRIHRDDLDLWLRGSNPEQSATKLKRVTGEPRRLRYR